MYGALICQTAWYLKTFPKDPTYLKVLVSTYPSCTAISSDFLIDCAIMHRKNAVNFVECQAKRSQFSQKLLVLWYYFIQRGIGVDVETLISCYYWHVLVLNV